MRRNKINKYYSSIIILLALLSLSCSNKQNVNQIINGENFKYVLFDNLTDWVIPDISDSLEDNYLRILKDLQIKRLPMININIWFNEDNFLDVQEKRIGERYPGSTGYISNNEIFILYTGISTAETALHEFVHIVSLQINPDFDNNPRWLWEAIAIYESNCPKLEPSKFSDITVENYPTLSELNSDFNSNQSVYIFGYTLTEFIIYKWDIKHLNDLIRANGDIESVLMVSDQEFEYEWFSYINDKYLN